MAKQKPKVNLIIDSGAFGAWAKGTTINVSRYAEFLDENRKFYTNAINLDVIPNNPRDVERAAAGSWDNYVQLRETSPAIIPVFHMGERIHWLEKILESGATYIGLGGAARATPKDRDIWLDKVFPLLCDTTGKPRVKVHGFALTSLPVMSRFPWFSVDSLSYIRFAASGLVRIPRINRHLKWDWNRTPSLVVTSKRERTTFAADRYDQLGESEKTAFSLWLKETGLTPADVETRVGRIRANAYFYKQFSDHVHVSKLKDWNFGLFAGPAQSGQSETINKLHLHLTVDCTKSCHDAIKGLGVVDRLVTYYEFRNHENPPIDLERYVFNDEWVSLRPGRTN